MCALQPISGSPFYGRLLPGVVSAQTSKVVPIACSPGLIFDPQILLQSDPVLQACFLITTADAFGNAITVTEGQLNLTVSMSVQLGLDVRQQQASDGALSKLQGPIIQMHCKQTIHVCCY